MFDSNQGAQYDEQPKAKNEATSRLSFLVVRHYSFKATPRPRVSTSILRHKSSRNLNSSSPEASTLTGCVFSWRQFTSKPPIIFLLFLLWSLFLTFPLILHFTSHIPLGTESVGTVPFLNLWILQHNIDQTLQGFSNYWDTPIFFPSSGTFAFSEIQPVSAILTMPIWLVFQSPAVGYNFLVIFFLTLNGWFVYWLLRTWQITHIPALLTGLLGQSMPFVAQEMGVLQLLAVFGYLWLLLFVGQFIRYPTWSHGFGFIIGIPITILTCSYYGFISLIFLPIAIIAFGAARPSKGRMLKKSKLGSDLGVFSLPQPLSLGGESNTSPLEGGITQPQLNATSFLLKTFILGTLVIILGLTLLIPLKQKAIIDSYGLVRSTQAVQSASARWADYGRALDRNLALTKTSSIGRSEVTTQLQSGQLLFPGVGLIIFSFIGIWTASRRSSEYIYRLTPILAYLVGAGLVAFGLSLGLNLYIGEWQPFQTLRDIIPGFAQLRSPFRFAIIVQVHLVLLAGFGLNAIGNWQQRSSIWRRSLLILVASCALIEMLTIPLPLQSLPDISKSHPWQVWLLQQELPPHIVMLPFAATSHVVDFEQTTRWMLENRRFNGRMVNGYSGFFPPGHAQLRQTLVDFPSPESLGLLQDYQVRYIVVDHSLVDAPSMDDVAALAPRLFLDAANLVAIYALTP